MTATVLRQKDLVICRGSLAPLLNRLKHFKCQNQPSQLCRLSISIKELDWGLDSSKQRLEELGSLETDYVIAADCLYIDEVRTRSPVHSVLMQKPCTHMPSPCSWWCIYGLH